MLFIDLISLLVFLLTDTLTVKHKSPEIKKKTLKNIDTRPFRESLNDKIYQQNF